jgi:hypothetical protein
MLKRKIAIDQRLAIVVRLCETHPRNHPWFLYTHGSLPTTIIHPLLTINFPMASTWSWRRQLPSRYEDHLLTVVSPDAYASATSVRIDGSSMRNR